MYGVSYQRRHAARFFPVRQALFLVGICRQEHTLFPRLFLLQYPRPFEMPDCRHVSCFPWLQNPEHYREPHLQVCRSLPEIRIWIYRIVLYQALYDHPEILDKFNLTITSSAVEGYTPSGIPYGSASGLIFYQCAG